ncbi:MAG: hypothetical protein P1U89_00190 [Verrucomicrobiales bacterium]|nr:hypothetical protein [Verrucomicrobiales bacterium]
MEEAFLHTTGQTETMLKQLTSEVNELERVGREPADTEKEVSELIYPDSTGAKLTNLFSSKRYQSAIDLLAVGSNDTIHALNYADRVAAIQSLKAKITASAEELEKTTTGLNSKLSEISKRISDLSRESLKDGFFPLINLQTKLIPSAEAMLDETVRVGSTDPIAAIGNPAKLATREIDDSLAIVTRVNEFRTNGFPKVQNAVRIFENAGISPDWIDLDFLNHSRHLETLSAHAVLWSVETKIEAFTEEVQATIERIIDSATVANQIQSITSPEIEKLENRISESRFRIAQHLHCLPDTILREKNLDPSQRVEFANQSLQFIKHAASQGRVENSRNSLDQIGDLINQGSDIVRVGNQVVQKGGPFWEQLSDELDKLKDRISPAESALDKLRKNYLAGALSVKSRLGIPHPDNDSVEFLYHAAVNDISEADALLHESQLSFRDGKLMTTGWQLEKASAKLELSEQRLTLVTDQYEAAQAIDEGNRKALGDIRWKHRSLTSKLADLRTRKASIQQDQQISSKIKAIEKALDKERTNPFHIEAQLKGLSRSLRKLDESVSLDFLWHDLATESIKSAGRTLRSHHSVLEVLESEDQTDQRKLNSAKRRIATSKKKLATWQEFLEKPNLDWKEAFDAGLGIDLDSSEAVLSVRDNLTAAKSVSSLLRKAAEQCAELLNWNNAEEVEVVREAALPLFETARKAFVNGECSLAAAKAKIASDQAVSALNRAIANTSRSRSRKAAEKKRLFENAVIPSYEVTRKMAPHLICPLTVSAALGNEFGFTKAHPALLISDDPINGNFHPNGSERTGMLTPVSSREPEHKRSGTTSL